MFKQGTMLELTGSSHSLRPHKRGIGPKVGSRGFYCGPRKQVIDEKIGCIHTIADIIFTRYGFEHKYRAENKTAILLFPITTLYKQNIAKHTHNLINRLNAGDLEEKRISIIKAHALRIDSPMVVAIGSGPIDLSTCDFILFRSWVESLSRSFNLANIINRHERKNNAENLKLPWMRREYMRNVEGMLTSIERRNAYFDAHQFDKQKRTNLIMCLQHLLTLSDLIETKELLERLRFVRDDSVKTHWLMLSESLMKPHIMTIIGKKEPTKKVKFCLDAIRTVETKLLETI